MDKSFFQDTPYLCLEYLENLKRNTNFSYQPSLRDTTIYGDRLTLGFSCFALKIYYMTSEWENLSKDNKLLWGDFINSFQIEKSDYPPNSYIDKFLLEGLKDQSQLQKIKNIIKYVTNVIPGNNFDTLSTQINKAINAETKQSIATLNQVGFKNRYQFYDVFTQGKNINHYLDSLDWSKPWASGAQYSSLCVYSTTQNLGIENELTDFVNSIVDKETGSYFKRKPNSSREVINGAMKILTGLDWLDKQIHYPEQLIDYCLNNKPVNEGCDFVDYVFVLYKCSKQVTYKRKEVQELLKNILLDIEKLFVKNDKGFSYFLKKSQTHYYGVQITNGSGGADIHGTTLCLWAIIMILDILDLSTPVMKIIKP